jgi:hypothetical protein
MEALSAPDRRTARMDNISHGRLAATWAVSPAGVVGGDDLDHVEAHEVDSHQACHDVKGVPTRDSIWFWRPGPRCARWVDNVDVEAQERRSVADSIADAACRLGRTQLKHVPSREVIEAELAGQRLPAARRPTW